MRKIQLLYMMTTINISLPKPFLTEIKTKAKKRGFASISEVIRDALRHWIKEPELTVNGFTPEFEEEVLRAAQEPEKNDVVWDGRTPFSEFVMNHPPKHK